jgi:hypothetical protein
MEVIIGFIIGVIFGSLCMGVSMHWQLKFRGHEIARLEKSIHEYLKLSTELALERDVALKKYRDINTC